MSKVLIAYFSASGKTRKVAQMIKQSLSADMYEIKPAVLYTKADLNWMNPLSRSSKEMKKRIHPELASTDVHIEDYDTILIGFPIWWYVAPTIINSFLEAYDFSNKKIVLFATSGSSGFGNAVKELKPSVDSSTQIIEGKVLNGMKQSDIDYWTQTLDL